MIVEVEILDEQVYSEYVDKVYDIVVAHGGRYLVRGGEVTSLAGDWNPDRVIVIEFDSVEDVERCFRSQEYLVVSSLRVNSTKSRSIIVNGVE